MLWFASLAVGSPKVVLITGASKGIGLETAKLLASQSAKYTVYGTYNTATGIAGIHSDIKFLHLDQTESESIKLLIKNIVDREKKLDVLVNNAGVGVYGPIEALSSTEIEKQFKINLIGPTLLMKEVLPIMRKNKYGRIVNVSSLAGAVGFPFMDVYSGSKFGLEGVCASLEGYVGKMSDGADIHCRVIDQALLRLVSETVQRNR